ncbi:MAG TPA: DUF87 domain-containing protein, partial [Candidatus Lokiarchaeia archaeon]|nr:DUF87 domain-containing protein [Candidatus Lokiarchaeia archaeon]
KIIASNWKSENGALFVFDPEGEYAVTDQEDKPGVLDITPAILITMRKNVAKSIGHNVYTNLKFNLKDFSADFILPKIIPAQKHEMIFFRKLMGLNQEQWGRLVDLLYADKWKANHDEITAIIKEVKEEDSGEKDESTGPIMNNLVAPIQNLHDPVSKLRHVLEIAAGKGYSVILDISLMDSYTALQFCSIVISYFFNKNQRSFTDESESLAKIVFAVEEAQSVLGTNSNASSFVELAKEGRKYHLGGIFITQQPGSIMPEILSQGDNFFAFHMISKNDILSLQKANAHYSDDVATQLLNEPVKGKCYMWLSQQPFVIPVKVLDFNEIATPHSAEIKQAETDLLGPILNEVVKIDDMERVLLSKLKMVLKEQAIDENDAKKIKDKKNVLTTGLYKKLTDEEKEFIDNEHGIARRRADNVAFGITFQYLDILLDKIKHITD